MLFPSLEKVRPPSSFFHSSALNFSFGGAAPQPDAMVAMSVIDSTVIRVIVDKIERSPG